MKFLVSLVFSLALVGQTPTILHPIPGKVVVNEMGNRIEATVGELRMMVFLPVYEAHNVHRKIHVVVSKTANSEPQTTEIDIRELWGAAIVSQLSDRGPTTAGSDRVQADFVLNDEGLKWHVIAVPNACDQSEPCFESKSGIFKDFHP